MGKTAAQRRRSSLEKKHPHGRGEDTSNGKSSKPRTETPPRAWGRPGVVKAWRNILRNTPTGVGKTQDAAQRIPRQRKHPHGRGEDSIMAQHAQACLETPPRAWGRPDAYSTLSTIRRNTPTGVGKTEDKEKRSRRNQKHPHGRGEDTAKPAFSVSFSETPPRAWGRR